MAETETTALAVLEAENAKFLEALKVNEQVVHH